MQTIAPNPFSYVIAGDFAGGLVESKTTSTDVMPRQNADAPKYEPDVRHFRPEAFRLLLHSQVKTNPAIPRAISRLGRKAEQCASALVQLVKAGSTDAAKAQALFRDVASRNSRTTSDAALRAIYCEDAAPVNLRPSRWQLDDAGWLALQLLLRIWLARRRPEDYPQTGDLATDLPRFDIDSAHEWWKLAISSSITLTREKSSSKSLNWPF